MTRYDMMRRIATTLSDGETLRINVTEARGRTLVQHYAVSRDGVIHMGHTWNGYGNLRDEYARRVLGR